MYLNGYMYVSSKKKNAQRFWSRIIAILDALGYKEENQEKNEKLYTRVKKVKNNQQSQET